MKKYNKFQLGKRVDEGGWNFWKTVGRGRVLPVGPNENPSMEKTVSSVFMQKGKETIVLYSDKTDDIKVVTLNSLVQKVEFLNPYDFVDHMEILWFQGEPKPSLFFSDKSRYLGTQQPPKQTPFLTDVHLMRMREGYLYAYLYD